MRDSSLVPPRRLKAMAARRNVALDTAGILTPKAVFPMVVLAIVITGEPTPDGFSTLGMPRIVRPRCASRVKLPL